MIDDVGIRVADYEKSKSFFERALAPLGYKLILEFGPNGGFGVDRPDFWIAGEPAAGGPTHVCFSSPDRETVDAFYAAAIAAGGTDNGPPGPRPIYHPNYYGAFVLDLDGNNIEAVCHQPE
jgi:catechol 2,3-dioxygenase-like lactoylglutathione lyase family enzyme